MSSIEGTDRLAPQGAAQGRGHLWLLVLIVVVTAALRIPLFARDLPYYAIDENDIVEEALAFTYGDYYPSNFKYGTVDAYLLSFVFQGVLLVERVFLGISPDDLTYDVFFRQTRYFAVGRVFHFLQVLLICLVMYRYARRRLGPREALLAFALGMSFPFELVTDAPFTIRIDTLQGLFTLLSIHFLVQPAGGRWKRNYALAGAFAGLNFAVKPLSALLFLPTVLVAHLLSQREGGERVLDGRSARKMALFMAIFVAAAVLANPYSVVDMKTFWGDNLEAVISKAQQGGNLKGHSPFWMFRFWGGPASLAFILGLLAAFRSRKRALIVPASYVLVVFLVYARGEIRSYWYNAMLSSLILLGAAFAVAAMDRTLGAKWRGRDLPLFLLMVLLVAHPFFRGATLSIKSLMPGQSLESRADFAAQRWIEANIPAHARMMMVGFYPINLPRIVADDLNTQARWSEHFWMRRGRNEPWYRAFTRAYPRYLAGGGKAFGVDFLRVMYQENENPDMSRLFHQHLDRWARDRGADYLVTGSQKSFSGEWEKGTGVERIAVFNRGSGFRGDEVKIFRLRR